MVNLVSALEVAILLMTYLINYVSNKTEDLTLNVFKMITGKNESKTLIKHISCECEYRFDGRKCNLNHNWSSSKCRCECKDQKEHKC